ncbi:uncharacterized protein si:ch211-102c2.4 [Osmerus eperlanus]|uniref:uncharacterized protein si:ch211-102c2.4 n=1 Tax=Osmerus eperlanus TaxID=29151 RepID=UPI002E14BDBB
MTFPVIKTVFVFISVLFWMAGTCDSVLQRLTCPINLEHKDLPKVWCKQSSEMCCTGVAFHTEAQLLDGGRLEVLQDSDSFTVRVHDLVHGNGLYWCGVLGMNQTIIKLAEGYFRSSFCPWQILRWILLPLLPIVVIIFHLYLNIQRKSMDQHSDIVMTEWEQTVIFLISYYKK